MDYPLELSFKIMAIAPQFSVRDASGRQIFFVKQKLFKLKEAINVFSDNTQNTLLYSIRADRILDVSTRYQFTDSTGMPLGAVRRLGMRSLWKAHYEIYDGDVTAMTIREENPWVKVLDGLVGEIPILGMFTGYMLHPAYRVMRPDNTMVMRMQKQSAFLEGRFKIEKFAPLMAEEEMRALLSLLMLLLLERKRG